MQRGKLKSRDGRLSAFGTIKEISEAQLEMLMKIRAGVLLAGLAALALAGNVVPASRVRAAYRLDVDEWRGTPRLQLLLTHMEPA